MKKSPISPASKLKASGVVTVTCRNIEIRVKENPKNQIYHIPVV